MRMIAAALMAGAMLATAPVCAADLLGTAPPPFQDPQAELGSNWYIRGDLGASFDSSPPPTFDMSFLQGTSQPAGSSSVAGAPPYGPNVNRLDFDGDLGFGYRVNNFLRFDATVDYRALPGVASTSTGIVCPNSLLGVYNVQTTSQTTPSSSTTTTVVTPPPAGTTGQTVTNTNSTSTALATTYTPLGYLYDTGSRCNAGLNVSQHNVSGLVNAYIDLGHYWMFSPYVGAGAGLSATSTSGNLLVTNSDGSAYNANLTATAGAGSLGSPQTTVPTSFPTQWLQGSYTTVNGVKTLTGVTTLNNNVPFGIQNWNRSYTATKYGIAWALMAGVGIDLAPSMTLDIGYRYVNTGAPTTTQVNGVTFTTKGNTSQQVRVGVRYTLD